MPHGCRLLRISGVGKAIRPEDEGQRNRGEEKTTSSQLVTSSSGAGPSVDGTPNRLPAVSTVHRHRHTNSRPVEHP